MGSPFYAPVVAVKVFASMYATVSQDSWNTLSSSM
jgi:hypothetical protein